MTTDEPLEDERDVELSSITAIYPELLIDPQDPHSADLDLEVAPTATLQVLFSPPQPQQTHILPTPPHSDETEAQQRPRPVVAEALDTHTLQYLPSLHLRVSLPNGYPDSCPPSFKLSTVPDWLGPSMLQTLEHEGEKLWKEYGQSQVVFAYIDYLHQESEGGFGLSNPHTLQYEFKEPLLRFDRETRKLKFDQETFDCGVCLEPKKGSACYRLRNCGHVFCVSCLQDFYNSAITEGDISSVKCLAPDCGTTQANGQVRRRKKQRTLHPSELLDIPIERSQVQRYVDIKLKKKFESDKSTIYCPRKFCQAPARSAKYAKYDAANIENFPESDEEPEDEEEEAEENAPGGPINTNSATTKPPPGRLSICSKCSYAFCRVCLRSWHGDLLNCIPPSDFRSQLTAEEQASYDYIRLNTSPCPTCESPCQKTHGCNHMRCFTCNTHFCYLCSMWLTPEDPYRHFNTKGTNCYMRLWELEEGDEGQGGHDIFGGARAAEQAADFAAQFNVQEENPNAAPGAANQNVQPNRDRGAADPGLQRFLAMAANDEEDGWDSDEMEMMEEFIH